MLQEKATPQLQREEWLEETFHELKEEKNQQEEPETIGESQPKPDQLY